MEVLIAMFVMAVGLVGVAALLPVGQRQVQKGSIDLRATELAEQAFGSIQAHNMTRPTRWVFAPGWDPLPPPSPGTPVPIGAYERYDAVNFDGTRMALVAAPSSTAGAVIAATTPGDGDQLLNRDDLYNNCILEFVSGKLQGSRRRIAAYEAASRTFYFDSAHTRNINGQYAPFATAPSADDMFVVYRHQPFVIDPFFIAIHGSTNYSNFALRVPRLTLAVQRVDTNGDVIVDRMGYEMAESIFVSEDDLVFDAPDDETLPPQQLFIMEPFDDTNGNGVWDSGVDTFTASTHDLNGNGTGPDVLKRQYEGNFSWLATFVPVESTFETHSLDYNVSVAVFYQRDIRRADGDLRIVGLRVLDGPNFGGPAGTLTTSAANKHLLFVDKNGDDLFSRDIDQSRIKPQQWVFLTTLQPGDESGVDPVHQAARWYRIASAGEPYLFSAASDVWGVDIRLVGADWNTEALGNKAVAALHNGVVGVFERRMRIDHLPVGSTN